MFLFLQKSLVIFWWLLFVVAGALEIYQYTRTSNTSWSRWTKRNLDHINNTPGNMEITRGNNTSSHMKKFFQVFSVASGIASLIQMFLNASFPIMVVLTLWIPARNFAEDLEVTLHSGDTTGNQWPEIYKRYKVIREFSDMINDTFGSIIALFAMTIAMSFAMTFDRVLITNDVQDQLSTVISNFALFQVILLAADVSNQVGGTKKVAKKLKTKYAAN